MSNLQSGASEAQMIELLNSIKMPIIGAGGGFAPIGTENYFEGTTAPVGWVLCDGSVLNISDYPELATYYASHYGASNHFGGDGVTTFAVPTKEGMPENTDGVYGEQERVIGVWKETVDGVLKQKPLYCKTINCGALPNNSTKELDTGVSDLEYIYYCNGECVDKVQGTSNPIPYVHVSALSWQIQIYFFGSSKKLQLVTKENWGNDYIAYVTIQYTKTSDSWTLTTPGHSADGNGVFCVKATVAGDSNAHHYSTEEQVVGRWIDGSYEYEKVFVLPSEVSISNSSWTSVGIPSNGFSIITFSYGCSKLNGASVKTMGGSLIPCIRNNELQFIASRDGEVIDVKYIILRYTKTS